jgi:putative Holliday junction resolvase
MKYLGIDYGAKRVGLAISDAGGTIAFPRDVVENNAELLSFIKWQVVEEKVGGIVVGDTRTVSGAANTVTAEADAFIGRLETAVSVPVVRAWEGWSAIEASRYAPKGEEHNDAAAAAIILQRYLDGKGGGVQ